MAANLEEITARVRAQRARLDPLFAEIDRVLVGQRRAVERLAIGLLTDGHILLEGVPGLAKTLAVRTLAQTLALEFKRVQFTPDLLPADVVGTQIYNPRSGDFTVKKGPVFGNVVLADEINRSPAKVQSALLEAMQEKQVTIGDTTFPLPEPFMVLATQNPLEQEGTYPLPEAQVDRFMLKVAIDYPSRDEELKILERMGGIGSVPQAKPVLHPEDVFELRKAVDSIHVDARIGQYIVDLVRLSRDAADAELKQWIRCGASPRATLALYRAAKAQAFLHGRAFVTPQDVKDLAADVLRHRIAPSYEAEAEGVNADAIVKKLLEKLPVP